MSLVKWVAPRMPTEQAACPSTCSSTPPARDRDLALLAAVLVACESELSRTWRMAPPREGCAIVPGDWGDCVARPERRWRVPSINRLHFQTFSYHLNPVR